MPISLRVPLRRMSQKEFGDVSYEVMGHVFAIHNELGRLFDERIYKQALANRMPNVRLEVPIDVTFESFRKTLYIDVQVGEGALFEFKAAERIAAAHRAQLLNYLLLCDLGHGKIINVRSEDVESEFVNTSLHRADRHRFVADSTRWNNALPGAARLRDCVAAIMGDWGTGLQIGLYEEAIAHFFGGEQQTDAEVGVRIDALPIGTQQQRLIAPGVALKLTALTRGLDHFERHARRLLDHLDLRAIAWINFNVHHLTFTTLEK